MAKKQTAARASASRGTKAEEDGLEAIAGRLVTDDDEQLALTVGQQVVAFMRSVTAFFTTARALEQTSLQLLDTSKMLERPADQASDEELQRFIKRTSEHKRTVEAHWTITSTIHQFHRRMTARRARSTDALDQANARANTLHNQYVDEERRRAAVEQERLRREAEEKARREREEELAKLEAQAQARELASPDLSDRERRFVDYITGPYASDVTGQRAAQQAGYKTPQVAALKLMGSKKIIAAIQAAQEAKALRDQAAARAAAPVIHDEPEYIAPAVSKVGTSRTTWSAEILDEAALLEALLAQVGRGEKGPIPVDILRIHAPAVNDYARQLEEKINLWPGVRAKKTTKLI